MATLTDSARRNFHTCIIMLILTTISVSLRFGVRKYIHGELIGSDWLCLLSLLLFGAHCGTIISCRFGSKLNLYGIYRVN